MAIYADEVAKRIYQDTTVDVDWTTRPDGTEVIALPNGWTVRIVNDQLNDDQGISWWVDSPDDLAVESDGWSETDFAAGYTVDTEIKRLVAFIREVSQR